LETAPKTVDADVWIRRIDQLLEAQVSQIHICSNRRAWALVLKRGKRRWCAEAEQTGTGLSVTSTTTAFTLRKLKLRIEFAGA